MKETLSRETGPRPELPRHRRENRLVVALALAVLVVWSAVSVLRQRAEELEPDTITRDFSSSSCRT